MPVAGCDSYEIGVWRRHVQLAEEVPPPSLDCVVRLQSKAVRPTSSHCGEAIVGCRYVTLVRRVRAPCLYGAIIAQGQGMVIAYRPPGGLAGGCRVPEIHTPSTAETARSCRRVTDGSGFWSEAVRSVISSVTLNQDALNAHTPRLLTARHGASIRTRMEDGVHRTVT